jgi:N-methylhydantoinase B/oxoprolinase/acetone carboxylase alpha subunit
MKPIDPITLEIFRNLFISVAEEMGVTLGRTAYSPNIKERRDYSCACFLDDGQMIAQAAHIPVHLGAMPASVRSALGAFGTWAAGDLVILNDPFLGGTHLPDITMVSPVIGSDGEEPFAFVSSRAHHADVGGMSPGSMALAREIYQEGLIIPPVKLVEAGRTNQAVLDLILRNVRTSQRTAWMNTTATRESFLPIRNGSCALPSRGFRTAHIRSRTRWTTSGCRVPGGRGRTRPLPVPG